MKVLKPATAPKTKTALLPVLERIAAALEKIAGQEPAKKEEGKPQRRFYGRVPAFAVRDKPPKYSTCKFCNAEILWEETPNGWRTYDPTEPWPLHQCKKREQQDTANVLPG
jgi:hypothetical protein